uniref:Uncharacterized protein n=1 Tax=Oryza sativa subsp. japonica TaxID=39947 RepID=Q2QZX9_ORYSJ|nr:hypothetical protein LOC_Os11g44470 [Oryza sativa Japonica Group]
MARWSRSVKWEGLRWDGELGFGFYRRGVRRCRFGGGEPTLAVKRSAGGSGGFVGDAKAATAWMLWAAKAVDRTADFEPRERRAGAVKVGVASWHGRGGGVGATGRKGGVSGALCPLPHQDKGESETALPAREKRKEEEEREPCSFRFWAARLERRVGLASPRWRLVACGGGAMVTQRMTAKREEGWFGGERGPRRSTRQGRRWCGHSGRP